MQLSKPKFVHNLKNLPKQFSKTPRPLQLLLFAGLFGTVGAAVLLSTRAATIYTIPASIPGDCSRDVTTELNNWIRSVPNGTTSSPNLLMFGANKCYRVDGKLIQQNTYVVGDRYYQNIILDGNGSKLDGSMYVPSVTKINHDMIAFVDPFNLTIQNFTLLGQHPNACNLDASGKCRDGGAVASYEWYAGIAIGGGQNVTLRNNKIINMYGDGILLHGGHVAGNKDANGVPLWGNAPPKNVIIENNLIDGTGRHGIGMVAGDGVIVRTNTFDRNSYHVVDMEYEAYQPIRDITFDGNTIKRHYLSFISAVTGGELGYCPPEGFNNNHVFINNIMTVGGVTSNMPIWESTTQDVCAPDKKDIRIENNTLIYNHGSDVNPAIKLQRVLGTIKIAGNRIIQPDPLRQYSAVNIINSTSAITIRNNDGREAGYAYMIDGIRHKTGINACGNTTATGTNQPIACTDVPTDTTPPTAPTNVRATATTSSSVSMAWNASTDNVAVTGYDITRNGAAVGSVDGSILSFVDNNLSAGTTYRYTVIARDALGNRSALSNELTANTTSAPPNPVPTTTKTLSGNLGNYSSAVHSLQLPKSGVISLMLSWPQGSSFIVEVIDSSDRVILTKSSDVSPLNATFTAPGAGDYTFRVTVNKKPSRKYTLAITYPF